ncbi:MAG: helix-turn-helix transcriptional regulator [Flavobacteriia bacterium]|nr:helix-turn-helix transcriptional regulator [Flavobacteriia bacterium]
MSNDSKVKIGDLIREEVEARGMKVSHFAKLINRTRQNVHNIFGRNTIDTDLLFEISKALNRDFFAAFSSALQEEEVPVSSLANTRSTYGASQDGVHLHIHLPDSPMSDEERSQLLSQIQSELTRVEKKKEG